MLLVASEILEEAEDLSFDKEIEWHNSLHRDNSTSWGFSGLNSCSSKTRDGHM